MRIANFRSSSFQTNLKEQCRWLVHRALLKEDTLRICILFRKDPRVVESNDEGMMQQLYIFKISFLAKNDRIQTFFGF
jgi:hypothetical protein